METKEKEFNGMVINGFVALLLLLALTALSVYGVVYFVNLEHVTGIVLSVLAALLFLILLTGLRKQEPNEAMAMMFFGNYCGTFKKTGFYYVNFLLSSKRVSLRARNLNVDPIKVNDKTGNPILIGQILVWKLKDTYKAMFEIDSQTMAGGANGQVGVTVSGRMKAFESFVRVQSDAALREVAGMFAYDDNDDTKSNELTLRSGGSEINDILLKKLNDRLEMSGLEVVEARINYLAYSPEIAAVMLRRQQAAAIIAAREKIVEGAVSMVKMALEKLSEEEIVELDNEKKAAMVSNLLVVLCADESAQPVVNTGTLYQ
ncbi:MAG: SPFH domain-containing protein [Lentimicrobiaceae bacterium]|nr:SPFH domain-containing protein [Lentimicrobiaceae bacterium]MBQ4548698.1 SPFH domain-containing protein [Bacteroidales bacterium]